MFRCFQRLTDLPLSIVLYAIRSVVQILTFTTDMTVEITGIVWPQLWSNQKINLIKVFEILPEVGYVYILQGLCC